MSTIPPKAPPTAPDTIPMNVRLRADDSSRNTASVYPAPAPDVAPAKAAITHFPTSPSGSRTFTGLFANAWYWFNHRVQARDATGGSGHELGHEVDLLAQWTLSKNLQFFLGYAFFQPGGFVKSTRGADNANWGFFQVVYKF